MLIFPECVAGLQEFGERSCFHSWHEEKQAAYGQTSAPASTTSKSRKSLHGCMEWGTGIGMRLGKPGGPDASQGRAQYSTDCFWVALKAPLEVSDDYREAIRFLPGGCEVSILIAFVDIHDRRRFAQDYVPSVASTLKPFGGRVVAASDDPRRQPVPAGTEPTRAPTMLPAKPVRPLALLGSPLTASVDAPGRLHAPRRTRYPGYRELVPCVSLTV